MTKLLEFKHQPTKWTDPLKLEATALSYLREDKVEMAKVFLALIGTMALYCHEQENREET